MRCVSAKIVFLLLLFSILVSPVIQASNNFTICENNKYRERVHAIWEDVAPTLFVWAKGRRYIFDGFGRSHPYELYDIQLLTSSLLRYASYCGDIQVFRSILKLYSRCFNTMESVDSYRFFYYPGGPRLSAHKLDKRYKMWLSEDRLENILVSSQFLFAVSETLVAITRLAPDVRSPLMIRYANTALGILRSHYIRWCFSAPGPFQVRGWGCKINGRYVESGLNHFEFLKKKLRGELGDKRSPSYCNAVTDTDMFIIGGVANMLAARSREPALVKMSGREYNCYLTYLKTGLDLLRSRLTFTELKDFSGRPVQGVVFDQGAWDTHPDYRYACYKGASYPLGEIFQHAPLPSETTWDISHARRYVDIFSSLVRDTTILSLSFFDASLLEALANQFVYKVFDGNFDRPLFSNFWGGVNGWYRVGYSGRKGYGYGPSDLSIAALTGGFAFLAQYNKDVGHLYRKLADMVLCGSDKDKRWLREHFSGNRYKNYKRFRLPFFSKRTGGKSDSKEILLLTFVPSLCLVPGYSGAQRWDSILK